MPGPAPSQPRGLLFSAHPGWPVPQQLATRSSSRNGLLSEHRPCSPVATTLTALASLSHVSGPAPLVPTETPGKGASEAQRGPMIYNASGGRAATSPTGPIQGRPYRVLQGRSRTRGARKPRVRAEEGPTSWQLLPSATVASARTDPTGRTPSHPLLSSPGCARFLRPARSSPALQRMLWRVRALDR